MSSSTTLTPDKIAEELARSGLCVCRDFLSPDLVSATRANLELIQSKNQFHRAGIGHDAGFGVHDSIRRDEVHWLEPTTEVGHPQTPLWAVFDSLRSAFNRNLFLGLNGFEGHYAAYPPGGFYQRHRDAFAKNNARVVSLIIYLNENWKPADGGQLRVYNEANGSHIDVDPIGGTLVCFMSQESEHEVLLSTQRRLSIAGWFTRR